MSELFRATVATKSGTKISLRVVSVHPDSGPPQANESFAIMLLREASNDSAFAEAVAFDDILDRAWQKKFARGFIRTIALKSKTTLAIEVADPAWIAHLDKGTTWDSTAFTVQGTFDACKPIHPEADATPSADIDDAFVVVPRVAWGTMITKRDGGPAILEVPAYAASAYTIADRIDRPKTIPKSWIGRAVRASVRGRTEDGALLSAKGATVRTVHMGDGSYGAGGGDVEWIARLVPKTGRRGTKLSYATVLARIPVELIATKRSGIEVTFTYRVPPERLRLAVDGLPAVLHYVRSGLLDDSGEPRPKAGASHLEKALAADLARLKIEPWDLVDKVAAKYIKSYRAIEADADALDGKSPDEVRAILEAPWPTATLRVKAGDAKWLAHLTKFPPAAIDAWIDPD